MPRKVNKIEKKILGGLVKKGISFVGTLSPEEIDLLSKLIVGIVKIEIEDDDEYETIADAFVDRLEDFFEIDNQ